MRRYLLILFLSAGVLFAEKLPTVAVIATGGTIAEKLSSKTGGAMPSLTGEDLVKAVPQLSKIAKIKMVNFSDIDSSQMTPELWAGLSKRVDEVLADPDIVGAVITHGTDTMSEGAFFLDLTLKSKKPVTFVGAMRDASDPSPDGPFNLLNGVIVVLSDEAKEWGVTVAFNQFVSSARDVRKIDTTNVQAFDSGYRGYLGYVSMGKVLPYHEKRKVAKFDLPSKLSDVALLKTYSGDDGSLLKYAVDQGAKGIVVEGVGAGNVNKQVNQAILYAISKDVPVVITSRVMHGGVFPIYGDQGGGATLQKEKVILGGDLISPKARLLLMLALSNGVKDHDELQSYFNY